MNFLDDKNEVNKTASTLLIGLGVALVSPWAGAVLGIATIGVVIYANFFNKA